MAYGEISCLVDACPRLVALKLTDTHVLGPALAPLSRLAGLRELRLFGAEPDDEAPAWQGIYEPLACLTALTRLAVSQFSDALCLLPHHLCSLTSLRNLSLSTEGGTPSVATLPHFSRLQHLTLLRVDFGETWDADLEPPPQLVCACTSRAQSSTRRPSGVSRRCAA